MNKKSIPEKTHDCVCVREREREREVKTADEGSSRGEEEQC